MDVAQARQDIAAGDVASAEARLRDVEDRLAEAERRLTEVRQGVEGKADREHAHPLPGQIQILSDVLAEIDREERTPERRPWIYRKLGGHRQ